MLLGLIRVAKIGDLFLLIAKPCSANTDGCWFTYPWTLLHSGVGYMNQATVDPRGAILLYVSIFISLRLPHEGVPGLCSQGLFRTD